MIKRKIEKKLMEEKEEKVVEKKEGWVGTVSIVLVLILLFVFIFSIPILFPTEVTAYAFIDINLEGKIF